MMPKLAACLSHMCFAAWTEQDRHTGPFTKGKRCQTSTDISCSETITLCKLTVLIMQTYLKCSVNHRNSQLHVLCSKGRNKQASNRRLCKNCYSSCVSFILGSSMDSRQRYIKFHSFHLSYTITASCVLVCRL